MYAPLPSSPSCNTVALAAKRRSSPASVRARSAEPSRSPTNVAPRTARIVPGVMVPDQPSLVSRLRDGAGYRPVALRSMNRSVAAGLRGVLFTDMVRSTQLRSELGDDRADRLRRAHDAMLGSVVAANGGQVTRWTGDGLKAVFMTASAAIAASIEMQRAVRRYGRSPEAITAFEIRVGLSVGEVTYDATDDDMHGVAAAEAARLEAMAAPGEILATDLVQRLGERRVDASFEDLGAHTLRGLDRPVVVVRVVDRAADAAGRPLPRALAPDRRFPLVGRTEPLAVALRCWDAVRAGSGATLLISG